MVLFSLGILVDSFLTLYFLIKVLYVDPARKQMAAGSPPLKGKGTRAFPL